MKKSKFIMLAVITSALASCHKEDKRTYSHQKAYIRSDSTANYSHAHCGGGMGNAWLWYYAFRPYGMYNSGYYNRVGYYSSGISESSNIGTSHAKSGIVRGGFGGRGFTVSS